MKKININLALYINSYCDFNCTFCYLKQNQFLNKFNFKKLMNILIKLKKYFKKRNIDLRYYFNIFGGEPLKNNFYLISECFKEINKITENKSPYVGISNKSYFCV